MRTSTVILRALGAIACAALIGCSKTPTPKDVSFSPLREFNLPAKDVGQIKVWMTNKPESRYEELGILTYKVWSTHPDELRAVNFFKARAAELGGDAIIMLESRTGSAGNSANKTTYPFTDFRAMLVRYLD
jgi:hypothetical protein